MVLHVDKACAQNWSDAEVAERWLQLYKGNPLVDRWLADPASLDAAQRVGGETIEVWRTRLFDLSWFMRA